jgi:hypothetical protein
MCNVDALFTLSGGNTITDKERYYKINKMFCKFLRHREKKIRRKKKNGI